MNKVSWKKRLVSVFVFAFVGSVAVPALADEPTPADHDPMSYCIGDYCCRTVCKTDAKGHSTCSEVCS